MTKSPKDPNKPDLRIVGEEKPRQARATRSAPIHNGLTEKQELFCQNIAREGQNYITAYKGAYNTENMKDATAYREASGLAATPKIAARIQEIVQEIKVENSAQHATRAERVLKHLENLMVNAKTDGAKLRAAELLGKTVGLYRDVQENRDGTGESLSELEAKLEKMLRRASK